MSNIYFGYKIIIPKEDTKQETIEQAAERLYPTTIDSFTDSGFDTSETERLIFKNGAKWQQEQNKNLYSEEEVHEIILSYQNNVENSPNHITYNEWFEQFKKKY